MMMIYSCRKRHSSGGSQDSTAGGRVYTGVLRLYTVQSPPVYNVTTTSTMQSQREIADNSKYKY